LADIIILEMTEPERGRHSKHRRCPGSIPRLAGIAVVVTLALPSRAQVQEVRIEHRVVMSTTSQDYEQDVDASLEGNVNRLAATGFEVTAVLGGDGGVIDQLLERKPHVPGIVDHSGQVFVIMTRAVGRPGPARDYRLLHTRIALGTEDVVTRYANEGFRLTTTAHEGGIFHGVFERSRNQPPSAYRVFANRGRTSWMTALLNDQAARRRVRRVVPMALEAALVELGAPSETPAELEWLSDQVYQSARLEARLKAKAKDGYRVQLMRLRGSDVDLLLLRPAGGDGRAISYDFEKGNSAAPCGRGRIVGAESSSDGDVFCVAEDPDGPLVNRGVDVTVRAESASGDGPVIGVAGCEGRKPAMATRAADRRARRALQLECELAQRVQPGYQVASAIAGRDRFGAGRISVVTTEIR
jgi:hypothetical protein